MSQDNQNELSKYLKQTQSFQNLVFACFDNNSEEDFQKLQNFLKDNKVSENKQKFITYLCFISKISKNYHRSSNFFDKVKKILLYFKPFCSQYCTNIEIFNIFKKNKLILLLLFNEKILIPNEEIYSIITTDPYKKRDYPQYLYNEFKSLNKIQSESTNNEEKPFHPDEDFDKKRQIGENVDLLCTLIRNDNVNEFIKYVGQSNIPLSTNINQSIYETNPFLIGKTPTLIEYALFHGSIQIIRYMICNNVSFPESSWLYSIHSKNYELIHLLEEKNVQPIDNHFTECLFEGIKCHHNEIADYILNNKITKEEQSDEDKFKKSIIIHAAQYHNYYFISDDYNTLTSGSEFLVMLAKERYYELFHILLTMRVGPGILCSCVDGDFGDNHLSSLYCTVNNNDLEMMKVLMDSETFNPYGKSTIKKKIEKEEENDKYEFTNSKTALLLAVERKYYEMVKLILSHEASNENEESLLSTTHEGYLENYTEKITKYPIHVALENGDDKILELLLTSDKIDVNIEYKYSKDLDKPYCFHINVFEKKTPLQIAIEKENVNAVRLLLSRKTIDVNKQFKYKLDKNLDGFDYDEDNQGNEEEEHQGDNERDKQQRIKKTALHLATEKGNIEIIKLLLNHKKIDINSREKYVFIKPLLKIDSQKTALQIAIEKKQVEVVKLLLNQRSISINERIPYKVDREAKTCPVYDDDGNEIDQTEANKKVIRHDDCLRTPLHVAVQTGCVEIIKLLLQNKSIDTEIDDGQGKLPIDYTENPEIKALLAKK